MENRKSNIEKAMEKKVNYVLNPFIYEGYESPAYFCDRTVETESLIANLKNGRNTTLISPRKIGKTGLIKHAFHQIRQQDKDAICIYVDIFHTQNQHDFVQALGKAVIEEKLLDKRNPLNKVFDYFSQWRPTLSLDPVTGSPTVSVAFNQYNPEYTVQSIFEYLKKTNREVFVAIDEFQTIAEYPEQGTEALLRSQIQFIHNAHFIFSGSKLHLMAEMFSSPKRPFYQSTATLSLGPIQEEIYYDFALRFFQAKKGMIDKDVFHQLYDQFDGYTWYLQSVLNRLYECEKKVTDYQQVRQAMLHILNDKSSQYELLITFLTNNQLNLLKAIAFEGYVQQPQSNEFIQKYKLPSSSSVKKALDVLKEKDLVYLSPEGYMVYDRFFDLWLRRTYI